MSSFGHESIEDALASAGFDEQQRKAIYFGNWLRDYSQLIDPKLVRAPDAPKDFPSSLSREALTEVADLLALKAFHTLQDTEEGRRTYTVVPEMLGVTDRQSTSTIQRTWTPIQSIHARWTPTSNPWCAPATRALA